MNNQCKFNMAWVGKCKKPTGTAVDEYDPFTEQEVAVEYCEKHLKLKCRKCGKQATHDCSATIGPMICGAPVCDDCRCH